jgi:hypothetical protein
MLRYTRPRERGEAPVNHRLRIERRIAELLVLSEQDAVLLLTPGCTACPCEDGATVAVVMRAGHEPRTLELPGALERVDADIIAAIDETA